MSAEVRAARVEKFARRRGVPRVIADGHRPRRVSAPCPATLVVRDEPITVGQGVLGEERDKPVGKDRRNQQQSLARSLYFVLQLNAVDVCFVHNTRGVSIMVTAVT